MTLERQIDEKYGILLMDDLRTDRSGTRHGTTRCSKGEIAVIYSSFPYQQIRHRFAMLTCLCCLFIFCFHAAGAAGDAGGKIADSIWENGDYSAVLYNNRNGLPTSEANAIAETDEGFLWIGSYAGLIRYDGNTFVRFDSTMGIGSVVALYADEQNRLWIGTNEDGLAMMEHGTFRKWNEDDGLCSAKIRGISADDHGQIYVFTAAGINIVDADLNLHTVDDPRIANAYIKDASPGSDGLFYCVTDEGDYFSIRNGEILDYLYSTEIDLPRITSVLPDPDVPGAVYVGTEDAVLYHGDLTLSADEMETLRIDPLSGVTEIRLIEDRLWICSENGIGVADGTDFLALNELPMNSRVSHVMVDYEGNLWFTSTRQGVMKVVSNCFSDVFDACGLPNQVVNSTCMYDDRQLFIATDTGMIVIEDNKAVDRIPLTGAATVSGSALEAADLLELTRGVRIRSIIRDSRGRMWISTWRGCGLLCYDQGKVTAFTEEDGLPSNQIRSVCEASDGSILVACTGGLGVIEDDRVTASYGEDDGIVSSAILSVCAAPDGDVILGSNGGGIYIIGKEGIRCVDMRSGLSSGVVMHIKYDPELDVFWLITGNAIAYMTTDYQVTTIQGFPYPNNSDIYKNSQGDMWILSGDGIYVVSAKELIANGEIKPVHYGIANGLPCTTTFNSYSELTSGGDLYIAGNTGVVRVNIESALEDINDLKLSVPFVDADGERIYPDETGGFSISSNVQKLTIHGFVFNYSLTDPLVSTHLEGFERESVTVNRSELMPVTYTNLPGGSYSFVMELKDSLGRGDKLLSVSIIKEKSLYEHAWFYVVVGLVTALAAAFLVRMYIRRKIRIMEQKQREESERKRISDELALATQIQADMLPNVFPAFPQRTDFNIYASMDPAKEVGGDFYDYFLTDDDHLCMIIADVSGKGIPAALFMMSCKAILENNAAKGISPAQILTEANAVICANNRSEMFVTVWLGILELTTGKLTASNAGHEYPVIKQPDGRFELLKDKHGFVVGGMEGVRYKDYELTLRKGAKLFLYTDGVPEATNAEDVLFGTGRILNALNEVQTAAPQQILEHVRTAVNQFVQEADQFDDLTMLCVEFTGRSENDGNSHITPATVEYE